jgi:hypothetical protein
MDLDPSLAFTAVIEMRPGLGDASELVKELAEAMSAANPPDRWAFARSWLDEHEPLVICGDCGDGLSGPSGSRVHANDGSPQCTSRRGAALRKPPGYFATEG